MLGTLKKIFSLCWGASSSSSSYSSSTSTSDGSSGGGAGKRDRRDGLLWFHDIGRCSSGDFSMAVVQANQVLEDQSQIESGPFGTFVGVYDGHGGPDAARYVCDNLFRHFREISEQAQGVTSETIRRAFLETEEGFTSLVSKLWNTRPNLATVGSCCLVGVVCPQTLYIANLGDSRVVMGKKVGNTGGIAAIQLSSEHNANMAEVRQELKDLHPDDPQIVVLKHGCWRVKGIIQVSRSIGDVYMKHAQYNGEQINAKFRLPEPMNKPILTANPSITSIPLQPNDSFLIFASDGLWEHLSNEQAVEIVHNHPRAGSAKRLIKAALNEAARKREMRYSDLRKIDKKVRRHFHDDITVIVLFLKHDLISRGICQGHPLSIRSALEH
ncbi:Protein phosphatase 2C (PP2C)-like domain [Macleaya cordata]|uniref:protein-serine/threonine phosphatase n=1 Tax=Macleaya cordata TaxID=56857 RepID=A0A200QSZ7_MACCD|nr:Protein phosphatase 2C (PP2C)-like domain [Macleaya cordata]